MKNTTLGIVIIILVIIAASQRGCLGPSGNHRGPDTVRVVDTAWIKHDTIIVRKVPVIKEIPGDTRYFPQPPADYETLKAEFSKLQSSHYNKKIYQDSVPVGKFGYIHITDTVSQNALGKRKTRDDFKIPVVKETTTITKYAEPTRQLYIGGGVNGKTVDQLVGLETGVLYKTKNDQLFGAKFNVNLDGSTSFGVTYYRKISLRKK